MIIIKKYANRRLYDTKESRYITLDELAETIRRGADVRVIDAASNEDLTQATLAQIILESRGAGKLLPVPLLTQLIRMGDDALAEFMGRYISGALELYQQARSGAQALAPFNPLATLPFSLTSGLARLFGQVAPVGAWGEPAPYAAAPPSSPAPPPPAPPPAPPEPAPAAATSSEVAAMRRELEELKNALRGGSKKKRRKSVD